MGLQGARVCQRSSLWGGADCHRFVMRSVGCPSIIESVEGPPASPMRPTVNNAPAPLFRLRALPLFVLLFTGCASPAAQDTLDANAQCDGAVCNLGCVTSADCKGQVCDPAAHHCVDCLAESDCPTGKICD